MLQFLKNILQLIINPQRGWEDVSHTATPPAALCREGFYPLLGIAALSCFGQMWHIGSTVSLIGVIQSAIIVVTVYFATLYFAEFMFGITMTSLCDKEPSDRKDSTFIIYCLAILMAIETVINLIPTDLVLLRFLPLYVGVIIYKGMRYLSVDEQKVGLFMLMAALSIIAPIYLLSFFFKLLMPGL